MKKVFSILLCFVFLVSSTGLTISYHFCGMKMKSVSLITQGCCCKKKTGMKSGCCKNKVKYAKIADDYSPSASLHLVKIDSTPINLDLVFTLTLFPCSLSCIPNNHSPPPPQFKDRVIAFRSILV